MLGILIVCPGRPFDVDCLDRHLKCGVARTINAVSVAKCLADLSPDELLINASN